jgi:hypothetical protein
LAPRDKWASIDDGLNTVAGLIHAIKDVTRIETPERTIEDESLAGCLLVAIEKVAQLSTEAA